MKIAGIQHDIIWEDPEANFSALQPMIEEAVANGAELIVLTELFSTGFSMNTSKIAESQDGPSTCFLIEQARRTGVPICGSVPSLQPSSSRPQNCLIVAHPDGSLDQYAKKHLFTFAGEDNHYEAGKENLTLQISGLSVSFFVCFDLRFAPEFWNLAKETDLFIVVANWPESRRAHWKSLLQARAIENQSYIFGINRVGSGDGINYSGDSYLFDPSGESIASAPANTPMVLMGEIEKQVVTKVRKQFPFIADR